jgi:hypothetical protein
MIMLPPIGDLAHRLLRGEGSTVTGSWARKITQRYSPTPYKRISNMTALSFETQTEEGTQSLMPTVNVYFSDDHQHSGLGPWEENMQNLREFIAQELTCPGRVLEGREISIRLLSAKGNGMIAPIDIEIQGHAYVQRIDKSDDACLNIRNFIVDLVNGSASAQGKIESKDVEVWMLLSQLGHSWGP